MGWRLGWIVRPGTRRREVLVEGEAGGRVKMERDGSRKSKSKRGRNSRSANAGIYF